MKVVILCGGQGTRLREETEYRPKPMVPIGNFPIIWHVMKIYDAYGFNDFILPLGYKGDMIRQYFMDYRWVSSDVTLNIKSKEITYHNFHEVEDWNITFVNTGVETLTGKRLYLLKKYLEKEDTFMLTYGDGISDININELLKFHKKSGKPITVTGIHPTSQYGKIKVDENNTAVTFQEKPLSLDIVNGGFMVFNKEIFEYLDEKDVMLEDVLGELTKKGIVAIYQHKDFWRCMDTYRDFIKLNNMWENKDYPWAVWEK